MRASSPPSRSRRRAECLLASTQPRPIRSFGRTAPHRGRGPYRCPIGTREPPVPMRLTTLFPSDFPPPRPTGGLRILLPPQIDSPSSTGRGRSVRFRPTPRRLDGSIERVSDTCTRDNEPCCIPVTLESVLMTSAKRVPKTRRPFAELDAVRDKGPCSIGIVES